jgi:hypothetical protein
MTAPLREQANKLMLDAADAASRQLPHNFPQKGDNQSS